MARMLLCGGLVVDAAATAVSLPGISNCWSWLIVGLLGVLPFAYGIAGSMLATVTSKT